MKGETIIENVIKTMQDNQMAVHLKSFLSEVETLGKRADMKKINYELLNFMNTVSPFGGVSIFNLNHIIKKIDNYDLNDVFEQVANHNSELITEIEDRLLSQIVSPNFDLPLYTD